MDMLDRTIKPDLASTRSVRENRLAAKAERSERLKRLAIIARQQAQREAQRRYRIRNRDKENARLRRWIAASPVNARKYRISRRESAQRNLEYRRAYKRVKIRIIAKTGEWTNDTKIRTRRIALRIVGMA